MKRLLLFLLILPLSFSAVAIYAKDFSTDCYAYQGTVEELLPQSPHVLAAYLRDLGFDVNVIYSTDDLSRYNAVIVLSCTSMNPQDVDRFLRFYKEGGGLIIDLRSTNPLADRFGVVKKTYKLEGLDRGSISTSYTEIKNGILVKGALTSPAGPVFFGYERMYYVGEPIYLPRGFNSGFATENGENVLGWKEDKGRVVVTGCLYCSGPLLLANLVDWAEDGKIDFPSFSVTRKVLPDVVKPGETLVDDIRVLASDSMTVGGEYVYGVGGKYCNFGEPQAEFGRPHPLGDRIEVETKFIYKASGLPGTCYLPPVLLHLSFSGKKRDVIVDPVEVTVAGTSVVAYTDNLRWIVGALFVLVVVAAIFAAPRIRKRRLLKEWKKYVLLIEMTKKRRLANKISEDAFKSLIKDYEERLQEIEAELRLIGVEPPSKEEVLGLSRRQPRGSTSPSR